MENKKLMMSLSDEKQKEICEWANAKYHGFYLKEFAAISEKDENKFKYVHKDKITNPLEQESGIMGVRISQTKIYLDQTDDEKDLKKEALKKALEKASWRRSLTSLRDSYNNDACAVCTDSEKKKYLFLKPNNLYYYEIHHILQQNFNNIIKKVKLYWFIDDKYIVNEINTLLYHDYVHIIIDYCIMVIMKKKEKY